MGKCQTFSRTDTDHLRSLELQKLNYYEGNSANIKRTTASKKFQNNKRTTTRAEATRYSDVFLALHRRLGDIDSVNGRLPADSVDDTPLLVASVILPFLVGLTN